MIGRVIVILVMLTLVVLVVQYYNPPQQDNVSTGASISEICDMTRPSVVSIWTKSEGEPYNQGSGFIISVDGLILTSHHVIDKADEFAAGFDGAPESEYIALELVASNTDYEIALLRIATPGDWTPLPLKPAVVKQGDRVLAMGYPEGVTKDGDIRLTVTSGIVSRISEDDNKHPLIIQTDAYLTYGSSGGPLYDIDAGGVIGICTWAYLDANDRQIPGINYAMSIDKAIELFGEYIDADQ